MPHLAGLFPLLSQNLNYWRLTPVQPLAKDPPPIFYLFGESFLSSISKNPDYWRLTPAQPPSLQIPPPLSSSQKERTVLGIKPLMWEQCLKGCIECENRATSILELVLLIDWRAVGIIQHQLVARLSPSRLALAGLRLVLYPINPAIHPTYMAAAPAGESLFFNIFLSESWPSNLQGYGRTKFEDDHNFR